MTAIEQCKYLRSQLRQTGEYVNALASHITWGDDIADHLEMRANVLFAYRHIEDAIMRLGKAIQAADGGVSVYKD